MRSVHQVGRLLHDQSSALLWLMLNYAAYVNINSMQQASCLDSFYEVLSPGYPVLTRVGAQSLTRQTEAQAVSGETDNTLGTRALSTSATSRQRPSQRTRLAIMSRSIAKLPASGQLSTEL